MDDQDQGKRSKDLSSDSTESERQEQGLLPCPFCGMAPAMNSSPWKHLPHKQGCFISVIAQQDAYLHVDQLAAWNARISLWRPIETVPKDGTEVLLAHDIEALVWTDEWMSEWVAANGEKGHWRQYEHWGDDSMGGPTHWMPLPDPPEVKP